MTNTDDLAVQLHRIWRRAVETTHGFLGPEGIEEIDSQLRESRFFYQTSFLLHRNDSGTVQAFLLPSETQTETHIEALFVDPDVSGAGIGSQLVKQVVDQAVRKGHTSVLVEVNEQNPRAAQFYAKHGFVQYARSELDDQGRAYPILRLSKEVAPKVD
ncbi:putative N-acetyltransferase YjaB [Yarrowia sp. C11]|nr:putative N-acetyltransferase YjaB [Yarrowia sp. C11]